MNAPPGIGPQRPPFIVSTPTFRQVAPPLPSLRPHPVPGRSTMIMTRGAPRPHSRYPAGVQQPFSYGSAGPPFMPSMPFIPYAIPMMLPIPSYNFPHPLLMQSPSRIQYVYHHHYHHLARDPQSPAQERAFPSQEARQRHERKGSPQVYDPDGSLVDDDQSDNGPVVVELEEVGGNGREMVVRERCEFLQPAPDPGKTSEIATDLSESGVVTSRQHCHTTAKEVQPTAALSNLKEDAAASEVSDEGTSTIECSPGRGVSRILTDESSVLDKKSFDGNPALHVSDVQHIAILSALTEDASDQLEQSAQPLPNCASTSPEMCSMEPRRSSPMQ